MTAYWCKQMRKPHDCGACADHVRAIEAATVQALVGADLSTTTFKMVCTKVASITGLDRKDPLLKATANAVIDAHLEAQRRKATACSCC
jgi:hypothetical protein